MLCVGSPRGRDGVSLPAAAAAPSRHCGAPAAPRAARWAVGLLRCPTCARRRARSSKRGAHRGKWCVHALAPHELAVEGDLEGARLQEGLRERAAEEPRAPDHGHAILL